MKFTCMYLLIYYINVEVEFWTFYHLNILIWPLKLKYRLSFNYWNAFILKQCCARSSFYENMVSTLMSAEEGFVKVPCFHKMKIAQTLFWLLTDFTQNSPKLVIRQDRACNLKLGKILINICFSYQNSWMMKSYCKWFQVSMKVKFLMNGILWYVFSNRPCIQTFYRRSCIWNSFLLHVQF